MVDPATVKFAKKKSAGAKGAARGGKRPRSSGRASSSPDHGQQLGSTAPSADNRPPTASPPHKLMKPAGVIDITGGESSQAGPPNQLDDLPFSEGVSRVVRWLEQAAVRNEDEKDRYSEQLAAVRARLGKANDEVKTIKAELAAQIAKTFDAEVEAKKARDKAERLEAELKTASSGQGEVLRAYTKRLLLSDHFSGLANDLAGLINGNAAMDALEEAAKDFPDLDISKYGYERLEGAALFSRYAEVIRGHLGRFPILDELASSPELLTAEQVAACPVDREPDLDAAFDALPEEIEEDDEEEEEQEAGGDPILSKGTEDSKAAEAEEFGEGPPAGQQLSQVKSCDIRSIEMSNETKMRVINAVHAMKAIGINIEKVKPALKTLLKLYDKNWAVIEEGNYRALADAIFERDEKDTQDHLEEEAQEAKEPERPLKRMKQGHLDGQNSSLNTSNTSMPAVSLVRPKDKPNELSKTHCTKMNGRGMEEPPQKNAEITTPPPLAVMSQSRDRSKGKKPSSSNSLVRENGEPSNPCSISRSQQSPLLTNEPRLPSHPMRLRVRGTGVASLQTTSKDKRSVPKSSSHAVQLKEPKVEPDTMSSPERKKTETHALITPKDEPITNDMPCSKVPIIMGHIDSSNGGDSMNGNSMLEEDCTPETSQGECSSTLEIASSPSGEVKISLSYKLAPGRPDFHMPSLEAVLKSVEDKCIRSPETLDPDISMMDLMKEMCECFLELGIDLNSQSVFMNATKSSSADARGAKASGSSSLNGLVGSRSVAKVPQKPQLTSQIIRPIHDVVDIAKGQEKFVITMVNEVNDECPPSFCYIRQNAVFQNAYANFSLARIGDNNCCATCSGDCLSLSRPCACSYETGGEFAYTTDGLVNDELLKECISMNRDPKKHCQYFCTECPLERSKCDDIIEPCKGHLVRKFIKECWIKCGCNIQCGNRVVQRGISRKLQVFMTPGGKGWGLRTLEELPKGAFVCEYVGEVLTNAELFERVLRSPEGEKHSYPVLLDADWCAEGVLKDEEALCLDATYYGNVARFINHKCYDSNLVEIPVEVETPDHHFYHLAFFTTRKVKAMEELTWDYGIDFDDHEHPIKAFRCQCGSKFCRNIKRSRSRAGRTRR